VKAAYTGHETRTFMDYLDLETGRTLTAEPGGGPYDVVAAAAGRPVPDLPPGFIAVAEEKEVKPAEAADEPAPEVSE
jgi:hypothetical protein